MSDVRKNILFVVPYNPLLGSPGPQGPKNVSQPLIGLVSAIHDVVLIVVTDDSRLNEFALRSVFPKIKDVHICRPVCGWARRFWRLRYLLSGLPPSLSVGTSAKMFDLLRANLGSCDLVHFEYFTLAAYIRLARASRPVALHCHDAYSLYQKRCMAQTDRLGERLKAFFRYLLFKNLERRLIAKANAAITVSPIDQRYLAAAGLSNAYYLPPAFESPQRLRSRVIETPVEILCVVPATYQHFQLSALRLFFSEVLPGLVKRYPGELAITLFGKTASRLKKELASDVPVEVVDFVEDYASFIAGRNWIYFYPQRAGAGLHTKVRDAMAAKLPVVGYREIMDAFGGTSGYHYIACESTEDVIVALGKLLTQPRLRERIAEGGHELLRARFGQENVIDSLSEIYTDIESHG